jgi:hypothetical protein
MINIVSEILQMVSMGVVGLFVGALLAEGVLLVPYWRTLPPAQFFSLHKEFGPRLYKFYAPLTIVATLLTVVAAVSCVSNAQPGRWATLVAALLTLSMVGIYFLYFKQANATFAAASINSNELELELSRWATYHWLRVIIGIIAFAISLLGVKGLY